MSPLQVTENQTGVTFRVKVTPRASHEQIAGVVEGVLAVRLNAPPVEGAANQALVKLLAKNLGLAKNRISIVAGLHSRDKVVAVRGIGRDELQAKLGLA